MADDNIDDDIFDDLYDEEPPSKPAAASPAPPTAPEPEKVEPASAPAPEAAQNAAENGAQSWQAQQAGGDDSHMDQSGYNGGGGEQSYDNAPMDDYNYGPINVKEDGIWCASTGGDRDDSLLSCCNPTYRAYGAGWEMRPTRYMAHEASQHKMQSRLAHCLCLVTRAYEDSRYESGKLMDQTS
ncbi:hypothetical protein EK21DRAFT_89344 [Setomelanomma holmii]|uniref:Uncharacterized protein n=1 Tax=Setomelanomma holmii TaxID=210430 RepID=A0A9P4H9C5_9PLEO|nr:hypothetical protein EK21DRAFT_89344 [Setomelanomma holmii]